MKGGSAPRGYTIVEVMIALAISGLMFVMAATFISGRQARTAFTQGVNELASRLQLGIEQVQNGQYTDVKVNCANDGTTSIKINESLPSREQGTNTQCVFLGKVFHFGHQTGVAGDNSTQHYETFSLAARRLDDAKKPIVSLAAAAPTPIPALTNKEAVPQYLRVVRVKADATPNAGGTPAGGTAAYALGFLQSLGTRDDAGDLGTGVQEVNLHYFQGVNANFTTTEAVNRVTGANAAAAKRIDICVTDDTRYALITIGGTQGKLAVKVTMRGNISCDI